MKKEATIFVKEGLVLLKQSDVIKLEEVSDCLVEKFKKELEEQGYEVETIRNKGEKMKTMKSPWHYCKVEGFDNLWHKKRDFWIKNLPETDWIMLKEYESDGLLMEISEEEFEEDSELFDHTWIHDPGSWEPRQRFFKRIQVDECPVTEKEERESKSVSIFERLGFTKEELGFDQIEKEDK